MFRVGQKVVCVDDSVVLVSNSEPLIKGTVYTVCGVAKACACYGLMIDVGLKSASGTSDCPKCGASFLGRWHAAYRFRLIDDLTAELAQAELSRVVEEKPEYIPQYA